jgi:hypothetical protein
MDSIATLHGEKIMKRFWQYSVAVILGVASYTTTFAQSPVAPPPVPADTIVGSGGYFDSDYGYHASTAAEGLLTGQARLYQGMGDYNRSTAEALKFREEARALYQDNYRNGLKTYFDLKRMNAAYRAETGPIPVSKEKLDQWNVEDQPVRLSRREYNSDTGRVQWPAVLKTAVFDAYRLELEDLFARRTANEFGVNSDFFRIVKQDATAMQNLLKAYLRSEEKFFSDQEYMAAKNFLDSLAHEARLAPDLDGLVAN